MGRPPETWSYSYRDLARLTGMSANGLQQHRTRGNLDPGSLRSVLEFAARHGSSELKMALFLAMTSAEFPPRKKPKKRAAKPRR